MNPQELDVINTLEMLAKQERMSPSERAQALFELGLNLSENQAEGVVRLAFDREIPGNLEHTILAKSWPDIADYKKQEIRIRLGLDGILDWEETALKLMEISRKYNDALAIDRDYDEKCEESRHEVYQQHGYSSSNQIPDDRFMDIRTQAIAAMPERTEKQDEAYRIINRHLLRPFDQRLDTLTWLNQPGIFKAWGPRQVMESFWPNFHHEDAVSDQLAEAVANQLYNHEGPGLHDFSVCSNTETISNNQTPLGAYSFYHETVARAFIVYASEKLKELQQDQDQGELSNISADEAEKLNNVEAAYRIELLRIRTKYPKLRQLFSEHTTGLFIDRYTYHEYSLNPTQAEVTSAAECEAACSDLNRGERCAVVLARADVYQQLFDLMFNHKEPDLDLVNSWAEELDEAAFIITESGNVAPLKHARNWLHPNFAIFGFYKECFNGCYRYYPESVVRVLTDFIIPSIAGEQSTGSVLEPNLGESPAQLVAIAKKLMKNHESDPFMFMPYHYHSNYLAELTQQQAEIKILPGGTNSRRRAIQALSPLIDNLDQPDPPEISLNLKPGEPKWSELTTEAVTQRLAKLGFSLRCYVEGYGDKRQVKTARLVNRLLPDRDEVTGSHLLSLDLDPQNFDLDTTAPTAVDPKVLAMLGLSNRSDALEILQGLNQASDSLTDTYLSATECGTLSQQLTELVSHQSIQAVWDQELLIQALSQAWPTNI
jgi:hypothetical protein